MHIQHKTLLIALNDCLATCEQCITMSLQEPDATRMAHRIQLNRDCADLCALTVRFVARGSEHAQPLLRACADLCKACSEEGTTLGEHAMDCNNCCVDACRRCEQACRAALLEPAL